MRTYFANLTVLARFLWSRDRIRIPIWIFSIVIISIAVALAFPSIYPPGPERDIVAETLQNPAMVSMIGPSYGLTDYHMGAVMAHQMLLFTIVAVALMNILLVIRHTRQDEENGRIEIIRSLPVGKLSNASATLVVLTVSNLALGLLLTLGLGILGLEGMDWIGSALYGAVISTSGIFFTALTLAIAQLTETSRAALGIAFSFLGLSYLLRAIGDVSSETLSLVSPLGLILRAQVYVNNYWWPLLLILFASLALVSLAFRLNLIRDLDAGFIAAKPGRKTAASYLRSPVGLVFRLQRVTIFSWVIGMFILGASYGSVYGDIDAFFQTSDIFELLLPGTEGFSLTDQFTATLLAVISMIGTIPVLLVVLKLRAEEQLNRVEHLLARAVSRWQLVGSYLFSALVTSLIVDFGAILGLWVTTAAVMEEPYALVFLLRGGLAHLPAYWIMLGIAVFLVGFWPKRAGLVYVYLGYTFFVIYLGGLLKLPNWMDKLTPFGYVPDVPLEVMGFSRFFALLLIAVVLILAGLVGYRHRDICYEV